MNVRVRKLLSKANSTLLKGSALRNSQALG
ncbi:hypothetical protein MY3296_005016 [Beauveria thailandica]